ncbi:MAG: 2-amino-4-hydroxy-6-hydroxymethyldihydropteridine diphosphokinase [Phycisphaerales bacterium]|nr:2-amino-4-hydroxy-6-hydroxymethyldihydropteridine diphosphokinase [Phycisphaerales bacterium]
MNLVPTPLDTAAIALGSNLGDRASCIRSGVAAVGGLPGVRLRATSGTIETTALVPPGSPAQPPYLNSVILVESSLGPERLMSELLRIEREHGRTRTAGLRWSSRTLDLDLLWFGSRVLESESLRLPHPELQHRRFVLGPLAQVAPSWKHPVLGLTVLEMLERLGSSQTR